MIRTLDIVCSECGEHFVPTDKLYYRDNYMSTSIRDTKFICPECIAKWRAKWQIQSAVFRDKDYVMTVDIVLEDGSEYHNMDCTPIDETETVVVGEDIPVEAQQKLYSIYTAWDRERKAHVLKDCIFEEEFMRTTVTCETYAGERYEKVAFRVTVRGELQTEKPMPDYIKKQIFEAYKLYEAQSMDEEAGAPSEE
ncbi:MAG: hypothetical protein SO119_09410 [Phascolarctobacterium sp.]|nr:hypothetical protein [Phascolarctobacterium sp.]